MSPFACYMFVNRFRRALMHRMSCASVTSALCVFLLLATGSGVPASEPKVIEHRFGTTRIDEKPERVVSLSFIGHDFLLALGVKPVALRHWYGDHPYGVWPWAQEALGDATPIVMRGAIDIERIASLKPDLIVGQWSGMTEAEYQVLSKIAPTIAPKKGFGDYGMTWRDMLRVLGEATWRESEAENTIAALDSRIQNIRDNHPDWQGQTASVVWPGQIGAYTSGDIRGLLLEELGLVIPDSIDTLAGDGVYYVMISEEDLSPIDTDALIWLNSEKDNPLLDSILLRKTLRAHREGREIYSDGLLSGALSHSSPLSLDYALDRLVPLLEAAVDGDPSTSAPTDKEPGL